MTTWMFIALEVIGLTVMIALDVYSPVIVFCAICFGFAVGVAFPR